MLHTKSHILALLFLFTCIAGAIQVGLIELTPKEEAALRRGCQIVSLKELEAVMHEVNGSLISVRAKMAKR